MITGLDATELASRIREKEVSPVEAIRAYRERIEERNPEVNAVVTLFDDAEERARRAERSEPAGPLHGVPFTIKDTLDTAGVRTTRGSRLFADHVPAEDATAVARLVAAGAIPLGKTNTPEFALWWETDNLVCGRTVNPHDPARTAGGSSGGEAAALAAGMSALGLGSDLGGSIRLPGHYCGVVGFKPTHGLVPLTGHWPEIMPAFMHVGPLARSVRDAALALSVIAGPDGRDWSCVDARSPEPPPQPRVAWNASAFGPVSEEVAAAVGRAAEALEAEHAELPVFEATDCNTLTMTLYGAGGRAYFDAAIGDRGDELHWLLRRRLGSPLPPVEDYLAAEAVVDGLRRALAAFFLDFDALLCPVGPVPAHAHDLEELVIDGEAYPPRTAMRATIPFNLTGSPAISVPFARSAEGLPIGVQLVGRRFEDETVLRLGTAIEGAAGG